MRTVFLLVLVGVIIQSNAFAQVRKIEPELVLRAGYGSADSLFGFDGILENANGGPWCAINTFYPGPDGIIIFDGIRGDIKIFGYDGRFKKMIVPAWPDTSPFHPNLAANAADVLEYDGMIYLLLDFGMRPTQPDLRQQFTSYQVLAYSYESGELLGHYLLPDSILEQMGALNVDYIAEKDRIRGYSERQGISDMEFSYEVHHPCMLEVDQEGIAVVDRYNPRRISYLLIPKPGLDIPPAERWRVGSRFGNERIRWARPASVVIMDNEGNALRRLDEVSLGTASPDGKYFMGRYRIYDTSFRELGIIDPREAFKRFGKPCNGPFLDPCGLGADEYRFGPDGCLYHLFPCDDVIVIRWCP